MRRALVLLSTMGALLCASWPARGQSLEVSGLAAYTPSTGLATQAPELSETAIRGGFTWGLQAGWRLTPRWGVEALWTRQSAAQTIETAAGGADLFTMTLRQLHGDVVYHVRPKPTPSRLSASHSEMSGLAPFG